MMTTFDIYTVGAGVFLERVLNANNLILASGGFKIAGMIVAALGIAFALTKGWGGAEGLKEAQKQVISMILLMIVVASPVATVQVGSDRERETKSVVNYRSRFNDC